MQVCYHIFALLYSQLAPIGEQNHAECCKDVVFMRCASLVSHKNLKHCNYNGAKKVFKDGIHYQQEIHSSSKTMG